MPKVVPARYTASAPYSTASLSFSGSPAGTSSSGLFCSCIFIAVYKLQMVIVIGEEMMHAVFAQSIIIVIRLRRLQRRVDGS